MKLTYYGHSCFSVLAGGKTLLFDPFITPNELARAIDVDKGTVKSFVAQHSSSLPDGSYGGVACGFAFNTPNGSFYYSGDTGLTLDIQLVSSWVKLDFAVLPVGDGLTMGAEDAVKAAEYLGVNKVVGVHYDTFGFIEIDHAKAIDYFSKAGMKLHLLDIGSEIEF